MLANFGEWFVRFIDPFPGPSFLHGNDMRSQNVGYVWNLDCDGRRFLSTSESGRRFTGGSKVRHYRCLPARSVLIELLQSLYFRVYEDYMSIFIEM
jgi:hypothetical protein